MNKQMESILQRIEVEYNLSSTTPGYACIVHKDGRKVFERCSGKQDETRRSLSEESVFRIASITKQFTAAAILQLVEQRKVSLQQNITTIIPELPTYCEGINFHHLLTHTSGIRNYDGAKNLDTVAPFSDTDVLYALNQFGDLEFESGSSYRYSNAGYCLLALAIAKISGTSYKEYLKKNIFEVASMQSAQVGTVPEITNRVYGYSWEKDNWAEHDQDTFTHTEGDGGIYASANELIKWQTALYEKKSMISESTLELMTTSHTATNYEGEEYGYGVAVTTINPVRCYLHHGVSSGFENALFYIPDLRTSIVLLSNIRHPGFNTMPLGKKIISSYLGQKNTF
ncbi:MAG: serine hydrolase domain-containing protein [Candidatus Saccharimonadales bacterium]